MQSNQDVHSIGLGNGSDVVRSGDSASDGGLLFVVGQALPREVRAATLRDLKNYRRLDIADSRSDMREGS